MADFLAGLNKTLEKSGFDVGEAPPPRWWISTGNFILNKIISGHFNRGIPQGRLTALVGPAGSGKTFVLCNIIREAQKEGYNNYSHIHVDTIPQVIEVTSTIIQGYKKEYDGAENPPKLLIACDSLDMLITDTESDNYTKKGIVKGDQGQKNKQLKAMLRPLVHAIKHTDITMVVTDQVYKNQDLLNGEGVWLVKDAVKYSLSQIVMLTKLKLKDDKTNPRNVTGIKMKCEGYKTRFAKPSQSVTIEVPYSTGMDPYNGLLAVAKDLGIVSQAGAWYAYNGEKFQSKNFAKLAPQVLEACEATMIDALEAIMEDDDEEVVEKQSTRKEKISKKLDD